jgi:hypothetical protein
MVEIDNRKTPEQTVNLRLNNTLLSNTLLMKKYQDKLKIPWVKWTVNTTYEHLWDTAKTMPGRKFFIECIRQEERPKINNLRFYLKNVEQ